MKKNYISPKTDSVVINEQQNMLAGSTIEYAGGSGGNGDSRQYRDWFDDEED